jgi:N6-L-threonylcarbamoyladenine synthase
VSFSGLKTALLRHVQQNPGLLSQDAEKEDFGGYDVTPAVAHVVASYQEAIAQAVADRTRAALKRRRCSAFVLGGGVSLNSRIRAVLGEVCAAAHVPLLMAKPKFTGDNGAMVAGLAFYRQNVSGDAALRADASPSLQVGLA